MNFNQLTIILLELNSLKFKGGSIHSKISKLMKLDSTTHNTAMLVKLHKELTK